MSARNSALRDYTDNVYTIVDHSNALGSELFTDLTGGTPQQHREHDREPGDGAHQLRDDPRPGSTLQSLYTLRRDTLGVEPGL